jgi:hypothetical protein
LDVPPYPFQDSHGTLDDFSVGSVFVHDGGAAGD